MLVRNTNLHEAERDTILWKWAPNGKYMVALTYKIQFQCSYTLRTNYERLKRSQKLKFLPGYA
jgi:hypothetical protein